MKAAQSRSPRWHSASIVLAASKTSGYLAATKIIKLKENTMKHSCILFSLVALFLVSLCSGSRSMAAHSDVVDVGSPTEVPLIAFVWQDLFGESFDAGADAMFIRSDKPASTTFGDGSELAVLALDVREAPMMSMSGRCLSKNRGIRSRIFRSSPASCRVITKGRH